MSSSAGVMVLQNINVVIACVYSTLLKVVEKTGTGSEGREKDEKINR